MTPRTFLWLLRQSFISTLDDGCFGQAAFDAAALRSSPHASLECNNCHADVDPKKLPHADKLAPVDCGTCHAEEQKQEP